jgi:hypothetical protein
VWVAVAPYSEPIYLEPRNLEEETTDMMKYLDSACRSAVHWRNHGFAIELFFSNAAFREATEPEAPASPRNFFIIRHYDCL